MSENRLPENLILCLDTSRSMYRTDYQPNRMKASVNALKTLIHERFEADKSSAFAIVIFNDAVEKITDFINAEEELFQELDCLEFKGHSALGEALALSIKLIIGELRKISAKTPRILVVSDGNYTKTSIDPLKMARLAQGLSIKIDTFRLGEVSHLNILKRLSDLTGGKYYYNNDAQSLLESGRNLAGSNIKTMGSSAASIIENPAFLRKIAADLLRAQDLTKDQEQKLKQIRGEGNFKKCSVCFAENDPITKGSFLITGRFCPNCQTPFHIHCLSGWAASQKNEKLKESGTCRCPHCFYLLKIPSDVTQAQKLATLAGSQSQRQPSSSEQNILPAKLLDISELGEDAMYNSCPICHLIFEEGQQVVKCGNSDCTALYHQDCFKKLEGGTCKNCGTKLHLY